MRKFCIINAAVAGLFFVCVVFGPTVQRDCGCVGKFRTIVAAVAGFCLCCCVWGSVAGELS